MKTYFHDHELNYDGSQLSSHFAYKTFGLLGDSAVAFIGPCEVKLDAMVDLEDVRRQAPIYSPRMLHLIVELFDFDLKSAVLLQRLLVVRVAEALQAQGHVLRRSGDDLYLGDKKLSVSIATRSPVSALIHLGLNVRTEGTPVPTVGLEALKVSAQDFGHSLLKALAEEYQGVLAATYKVRGVP